jgi:hypothetical protein
MVWMNEQELKETAIVCIKSNNKQTGWILQGIHFDVFCWNSDKLLLHLLTALELWADEGRCVPLIVKANTKEKRGFIVEKNEGNKAFNGYKWVKEGNAFKFLSPSELEDDINPFI